MQRYMLCACLLYAGIPVLADDPNSPPAAAEPATSEPASVSFSSDVAPILQEHCLACHGAKKAEGGYRVDSYAELGKAGDSGEDPLGAAQPGESELLRRLSCDESERMPAESEALSSEQIQVISKWIESGAAFDGASAETPLELVIPPRTYANAPESYAHPLPITALAFSPDGTQLIVAGYHELTVWDIATQKLVRRIGNIGQRVYALAFSPGGNTLAVACGEPGKHGEVRLVDFTSGAIQQVIARTQEVVLDIAFRPQSSELAVASADNTIRIYDTQTGEQKQAIASHADWVTAIAWSDDGTRLASASRDKSAKVYDGSTLELLSSYLGHAGPVRGITILPGATQVMSAGADHKLHRWNIEGAAKVAEVNCASDIFKIARGEDYVLVPCAGKRLVKVNLADNKISQEFAGHADWVISSVLHDNQLASGALGWRSSLVESG